MSAVPHIGTPDHRPGAAVCGRWTVVPDASQARFHVRDKLVTTVHGTLPVEDGTIVVSSTGDVTQAWVSVSVAGIATGNAHRDRDLLKARFLDAGRFPTVRITVDTATMTSDGCTATGTVLARGIHAPADLTAALIEGPGSPSEVRVHVTARLDRRPLGIKAPTLVVGRFVDLDADLTFRRVQDAEPSRDAGALR